MKTLTDITSNLNTKINTKADSTIIPTLASKDELSSGLSGKANSSHRHNWNDVDGKPTFHAVATSGNFNDLTNKPQTIATQSWDDGTNWYVKYSNGRLEQGGITSSKTVNFPNKFANTNYVFFNTGQGETGQKYVGFGSKDKKTTSITIADWGEYCNATSFMWFAVGRY